MTHSTLPIDRTFEPEQQNTNRYGGDVVRQGTVYHFAFNLTGTGASSFTPTCSVLQYPGDTPALTPTLTYSDSRWRGSLTAANTTTLGNTNIGQWIIYAEVSDGDEELHAELPIHIAKGYT